MFARSCKHPISDKYEFITCIVGLLVIRFLLATAASAVARLSHRNSVCPSVTRVDQSKTVQATITKISPTAARKTLVSGTVKLFHKFEKSHPEWER